MIKKIMDLVSYIISFLFQWLFIIFPFAIVISIPFLGLINLLVFQEPIGMWFIWVILVLSIFSSFGMTIQTFEK